jgi:hypothetical protein
VSKRVGCNLNFRIELLKSDMHAAVLKEINSTCECFSKEVILEEFEAYFEVLERSVFLEVLRCIPSAKSELIRVKL